MSDGLAKTRGSYLKEVLRELEANAHNKAFDVADDSQTKTAWTFGYYQALEDVYDKMESEKS